MTTPTLHGNLITLRPATMEDRRAVYDWAANSDTTAAMMGSPLYPDNLPPTWEEFCEDHLPHFFDGSAPELGRIFIILVEGEPVGQVYYNDIWLLDGKRCTELDIWMRAEKFCGKGYGSDAVQTLCDYLARDLNVAHVMMQPSGRNPRAIRSYEKIGFARVPLSVEEAQAIWGPNDYWDSVYMVKTIQRGEISG